MVIILLIEPLPEQGLLQQLPPHARDVAEHLLTVMPLSELLISWQGAVPDHPLLEAHNVPIALWMPILEAALLAKITSFTINEQFSQEEMLYLIKIACASARMPLDAYSLKEVLAVSQAGLPVLYEWLVRFTSLLKQAHH
ncbi:MAG: hypothetical protein GXO35_07535 [Gammaproteobacteria bacterium]|nr:hypothetical protein [Gammaproteobacteria bacterium]